MLEFTVPTPLTYELTDRSASSDQEVGWDAITRRIASGDHDAFELYYERTFMIMFGQIQRLIGSDEQTTLDMVQLAMMKVIRSIKPLPDESAVIAWSRAVAKSVAYDWLRKESQKPDFVSSFEQDPAIASVEGSLLAEAQLRWMEDQLREMPGDLQKIISLRYRLGWSLRRIGELLGLKTGAVDGRLRRAIEALQAKAKREFNE